MTKNKSSTIRNALQLMEYNWARRTAAKQATDLYDREQLRYNPINWSGSLKWSDIQRT